MKDFRYFLGLSSVYIILLLNIAEADVEVDLFFIGRLVTIYQSIFCPANTGKIASMNPKNQAKISLMFKKSLIS